MNFMCFFIAYLQIARLRNQGISKIFQIIYNERLSGYSAKQTDNSGFFATKKRPENPDALRSA